MAYHHVLIDVILYLSVFACKFGHCTGKGSRLVQLLTPGSETPRSRGAESRASFGISLLPVLSPLPVGRDLGFL